MRFLRKPTERPVEEGVEIEFSAKVEGEAEASGVSSGVILAWIGERDGKPGVGCYCAVSREDAIHMITTIMGSLMKGRLMDPHEIAICLQEAATDPTVQEEWNNEEGEGSGS